VADVTATKREDFVDPGLVLVRVPPGWLGKGAAPQPFLRRVLIFACPDRRDLLEAYGLAKRCFACGAESVGVTIHGARSVTEAEHAFLRLARTSERHLGRPLQSYGLLVDDLQVYRSIVSRRPIGLTHPHTPAARALRDVARMLFDDLRGGALA
jgi:MinD-like ATPase involved in chromosome partitioning or flagellar assembly